MSLDWNASNVENAEIRIEPSDPAYKSIVLQPGTQWRLDGDDKVLMNPITQSLIFKMSSIGLGSITEDNLDEWRYRMYWMKQIDQGSFDTSKWNGDGTFDHFHTMTFDDVKSQVGLTTNVSNRSREEWFNRFVNSVDRTIKYQSNY